MIDITTEKLIRLGEAAKLIPPARSGRRTHESTILRWIITGPKAPDGTTVRLDGLRVGGKWHTTNEAMQRFAEALTPNLEVHAEQQRRTWIPRAPSRRQKAAERAGRELAKLGI
jgi:Protein of unknown function (DUF1580)